MAMPTLLLVDDEPLIADSLVEWLHEEGFDAVAATDAFTAINIARGLRCLDLVITDYYMPDTLHGTELIRRVREIHPDVSALLVSGHPVRHHAREARAHFLPKPFTPEELARTIRAILQGN